MTGFFISRKTLGTHHFYRIFRPEVVASGVDSRRSAAETESGRQTRKSLRQLQEPKLLRSHVTVSG